MLSNMAAMAAVLLSLPPPVFLFVVSCCLIAGALHLAASATIPTCRGAGVPATAHQVSETVVAADCQSEAQLLQDAPEGLWGRVPLVGVDCQRGAGKHLPQFGIL